MIEFLTVPRNAENASYEGEIQFNLFKERILLALGQCNAYGDN